MVRFLLGHPGSAPLELAQTCRGFINSRAPQTLRAGFAYATLKGAKYLVDSLDSGPWRKINKKFIVGLHQGITEPQAIRLLRDQPNSSVKLSAPNNKMDKNSLTQHPIFHPKIILFSDTTNGSENLSIVSSANLTARALGLDQPGNYECGQVTRFTNNDGKGALASFATWWDFSWSNALDPTENRLARYAELRLSSFQRNPDLLSLTEMPSDIGSASTFWIEVGKASGIARHQVEFPRSLASFFGPPEQKRIDFVLQRGNMQWSGRPLSHKKTSYGVDIWRLGMPTLNQGGQVIQDRIIRFSRTATKSCFRFDVADSGSPEANAWQQACNLTGHLGQTSGGAHPRRYGYC